MSFFLPTRKVRTKQPQRALPASYRGRRILVWSAPVGGLFGDQLVTRAAGSGVIKLIDGLLQLPGDATTYLSLASPVVLTPPYTLFIEGKVPSGSDAYFCGNAASTSDFVWGTSASGFRVRGANSTAVFGNPTPGKTSLFIICCDNKGTAAYRAYQDSVSLGADSNAIGAQNFTLASIGRGRSDATAIPANASLGLVAALPGYSLPVEAVRELGSNPWRLFGPTRRRTWVAVGGSTLNASASGGAEAAAAASFAAEVALAAVGVSIGSGAAQTSVLFPLSSAGLAVSGGNSDASATVTLSASALAQSAGQAGLSASVLLAGAAAAEAAGNAALATLLNELAAGAAQAGGTSNLTGSAPGEMSAAGNVVAAGQTVLSISVQLQATGAAQADGVAVGQVGTAGDLSAAGQVNAGGWAHQSALVNITAAGFVQAMGHDALAIEVPLIAQGADVATGHANISVGGVIRSVRLQAGRPDVLTDAVIAASAAMTIHHGAVHV